MRHFVESGGETGGFAAEAAGERFKGGRYDCGRRKWAAAWIRASCLAAYETDRNGQMIEMTATVLLKYKEIIIASFWPSEKTCWARAK